MVSELALAIESGMNAEANDKARPLPENGNLKAFASSPASLASLIVIPTVECYHWWSNRWCWSK
jgi:hypothetical protein